MINIDKKIQIEKNYNHNNNDINDNIVVEDLKVQKNSEKSESEKNNSDSQSSIIKDMEKLTPAYTFLKNKGLIKPQTPKHSSNKNSNNTKREDEVNIKNNTQETNYNMNLVFDEQENTPNITNYLLPEQTFKDFELNKINNTTEELSFEFSKSSIQMISYINILLAQRNQASALIIDYGEFFSFENSLRGILNQKILKKEELLQNSGKCDLSGYVNFKLLASVVGLFKQNKYCGLIKQGDFLELLGANNRISSLISQTTKSEDIEKLNKAYNKLVSAEEMGDNFKVMYIKKRDEKDVYPFVEEVLDKL